jgi:hypothetical protein
MVDDPKKIKILSNSYPILMKERGSVCSRGEMGSQAASMAIPAKGN